MERKIVSMIILMSWSHTPVLSQIAYPFGFQGMERADEVSREGNSYNTPLRQYDSRLGQWRSVDPVQKHHVSSYIGLGNNPVSLIDPRGADDEDYEEYELSLPEGNGPSLFNGDDWNYRLSQDLELETEEVIEARIERRISNPIDLRVYGIGRSSGPRELQGTSQTLVDITPYTGNYASDLLLSALEILGVPILSYAHLNRYSEESFRRVHAYSGGSPMVRNAFHYGYIRASEFHLYGAPGIYNPLQYGNLPILTPHANPDDFVTWFDAYYFNDPIVPGMSNPTFIFLNLTIPYEALIQGAINGQLGELHTYEEFNDLPILYRP